MTTPALVTVTDLVKISGPVLKDRAWCLAIRNIRALDQTSTAISIPAEELGDPSIC